MLEGNLPQGTMISIGNVSDMFVDVQCTLMEDDVTRWEWHVLPFFTPTLPRSLSPLTTSYNESSGLLRVFASFIREHGNDGMLSLLCGEYEGTRILSTAALPLTLGENDVYSQFRHQVRL